MEMLNGCKREFKTDDGSVWLMQGDSREIVPQLSIENVIAITDPPYGIALSNHSKGKERRDMEWTIAGDESGEAGQWIVDFLEAHSMPSVVFASPMKPWGGKWRQHLAWEKGEHVSGGGDPWKCWKPSWELIQIARTPVLNGSREGAVLRFQANKDDYALHPSPKPIELLCYLVGKVSTTETILDTFMGAGSTGIACARLGRKFIGIEIDDKHYETAVNRITDELARTALLEPVATITQRSMFIDEDA
jgi:DNA modification methylase